MLMLLLRKNETQKGKLMDESQHRMVEISAKLRAQGHRVTPQRMAIMKNLIGNKEHPSVDQIYACVKKDFPCFPVQPTQLRATR